MDMQNVIYAVAVLFIMGIVFAILLGVAAKVFAVEVDERVPLVRECLPGANCGGCGFPGCDGLAAAIVEGRAPVNGCPVGGAAAAEKIDPACRCRSCRRRCGHRPGLHTGYLRRASGQQKHSGNTDGYGR